MRKEQSLQPIMLEQVDVHIYLMSYKKNSSKWIKNANIRDKTIKLLEENKRVS